MTIEKNNHDIPDYLDKEFFRNALISKLNDKNIEIQSLDFSMGSSGGENYLSFIYRTGIYYNHGEKDSTPKFTQLIVKSIPLDGMREAFAEMDIFNKEKQMYFEIIPRIEDLLQNVKIAPECYYAVREPIATIVFEDLGASGHRIADRCLGLDEEHCKIVLTKLGQYHAGAMLLMEKDPSIREIGRLKHGIFSSVSLNGELMRSTGDSNFSRLIKTVSAWPGYEDILVKLKKIEGNEFNERAINTIRVSNDDIVTVCHGDIWVNNFMYKYMDEKDTPTDVALLDFQGSVIGSLGLDLNYFLVTSPQIEVLINKKDTLIEAYFNALKSALDCGGYKNVPTIEEIKNEIKKKAFYGFFASVVCLPPISMNKSDSAENSIEKLMDENYRDRIQIISFASKRFTEMSKYLLKKFDKLGIFD